VLLSHLDVVPAEAEEWAVAPFAGVSGGGYVVGRGALDAKGVTVVHLLTLKELRRRGIALQRDVILLATPDEETGGEGGAGWIVRQRRELLGGADLLLTEGGGILPGDASSRDIWGVAFVEKTPCWLKLRSRGLGGHGSVPPPDSATRRLVRALTRSEGLGAEIRVVPEVARMFELLAPLAAPRDRDRFLQLRGALALDPGFRERFMADPGRAALVRNTMALTMLEGSQRSNVVPAEARATLDVRLLPGESCPAFVEQLTEAIDDPAVEITIRLQFESRASATDTPLMRAIQRTAERADPPGLAVPRVITGFTDAHWFRDLGITAYGFVPRRLRPIETRTIHGPNERVSVDNLEFGVETLLTILQQLDQQSGDVP
jgi:acetylornithine deacetylase/succinyl-diaminopimelate desuccinylase-like protein